MSNSREFDCSRVRQFETFDKKLYAKASLTLRLTATKYQKQLIVMPNKPEQKLSNPSIPSFQKLGCSNSYNKRLSIHVGYITRPPQ